nr:rod shape-determining protein MreC [uncultured Mediterraneibacter sp.]
MKKKNQTSHTNRYILIGLSVFCALMMVLSSFSDRAAGPFKALANITVIPLQQGINHIGGWMGDMKDNFATLQQLQDENDRLQEQVDALTTENNYLLEESFEYERLQELYELDQNYAEYEKTAAHVIGRDSGNWFNTFTIDKGSRDGIAVDMNVLAGSGLVGIVTEVGPTWSKVRSIIDDSTNVSGMVLSTSDTCIVKGDLSLMSSGQIAFDQMENNENTVAVGDQIVTSYISDKYLQGILIGSISEINVDSNNLTRSGYITPAVDFRNIQEVLVITTTKAELTGENETEEQ